MSVWLPSQQIKVKVLGLARRGAEILVGDVPDDQGRVKGVRPLGGTVEFGETREATLKREFMEELGTEITIEGDWFFVENIYEHEGSLGHEMVFLCPIVLNHAALYAQDTIYFVDSGIDLTARWRSLQLLKAEGLALYPSGLADHAATIALLSLDAPLK